MSPDPSYDFVARALAAYRRFGALMGPFYDGYLTEIEGRLYVVVHKHGACHAAYLVRNNNRLRRIWQWPDAIW